MKNNSFNQPYCSIITVSYKSQSDDEQLISSVFEGAEIDKRFEVIVVSNNNDLLDLAEKFAVQVVQTKGMLDLPEAVIMALRWRKVNICYFVILKLG